MIEKLRPPCLSADPNNPDSFCINFRLPFFLLWCPWDCSCACPCTTYFLTAARSLDARRTSGTARSPWTCSHPFLTPWTLFPLTRYFSFIFIIYTLCACLAVSCWPISTELSLFQLTECDQVWKSLFEGIDSELLAVLYLFDLSQYNPFNVHV